VCPGGTHKNEKKMDGQPSPSSLSDDEKMVFPDDDDDVRTPAAK